MKQGQKVELAVVYYGRTDGVDRCVYDTFNATVDNCHANGVIGTELLFEENQFGYTWGVVQELGRVVVTEEDDIIVFCLNNEENILKAQKDISKHYREKIQRLQEEIMMWEDELREFVKFPPAKQ
jgi:hypothetical protein